MKKYFLISVLTLWSIGAYPQDGLLDASFDPGPLGAGGAVRVVSIQNNGKIILGGSFNKYSGTSRKGIARINSDGTLDASFDPGAGVTVGPATGDIYSAAI